MPDKNLAAVCGLYCGTCKYFQSQCQGCGYVKGKPFWTVIMKVDVCPLHDCCVSRKQLEHCGLCDEVPCETFTKLRDPSMSEEEAEESLRVRKKELLKR